MKTIGVIFGGRSVEHEVSVITGMQIVENMDREKYKVLPIYINKDGKWLVGKSLENFKTYKENDFSGSFKIPKGLLSISSFAFSNCAFTGEAEIPDGVTCIHGWAFSNSENL